ncbi:MAG: peptidase MA family metallohydrolase, partial [Candidatus Omnitrophica bacterium]|nr:peptidase MA family metallohydrolase [Candidatus Omnitrophota bacterium]
YELGHIIFREFVGFDRRLPIWMDEGVVSYLEKEQIGARLKAARTLARMKSFMTLEELTAVRSPETIVLPYIFYSEAASVIEFLMDEYGKDKFVSFCQRLKGLRQGEEWFDAMKDVYGFKDLAAMNEKWVVFLQK